MNTQLNNLLNIKCLNGNTVVKVEGINTGNNGQQKKTFTAAELWNIQRRRRTKNLFCLQLGL